MVTWTAGLRVIWINFDLSFKFRNLQQTLSSEVRVMKMQKNQKFKNLKRGTGYKLNNNTRSALVSRASPPPSRKNYDCFAV